MSSQPYFPPPPTQEFRSDYPTDPTYASGALTTTHRAPSGTYYPPTQDPEYLDPRGDRHHKNRHHSRDEDYDNRDRDYDDRHTRHSKSRHRSRSNSRSRAKSVGATAAGGAAGAFLGHELGHSTLGTVGGLVAGAWGAHELEKKHERHREKKRFEEEGYEYGGGDHRSGGGGRHHSRDENIVDQIKDKVGGFIDEVSGGGDREKREKRRSRSHVPSSRGARYDEYSDDDGYYEKRVVEKRSKGGRDYY